MKVITGRGPDTHVSAEKPQTKPKEILQSLN